MAKIQQAARQIEIFFLIRKQPQGNMRNDCLKIILLFSN